VSRSLIDGSDAAQDHQNDDNNKQEANTAASILSRAIIWPIAEPAKPTKQGEYQ
jgi:hypothetical protein